MKKAVMILICLLVLNITAYSSAEDMPAYSSAVGMPVIVWDTPSPKLTPVLTPTPTPTSSPTPTPSMTPTPTPTPTPAPTPSPTPIPDLSAPVLLLNAPEGIEYGEDGVARITGERLSVSWDREVNQGLSAGYWAYLIDSDGNMRELDVVEHHEVDIDISDLSAGNYTVRVDTWSSFFRDSAPISTSIQFIVPEREVPKEVVVFGSPIVESAVRTSLGDGDSALEGPIYEEDLAEVTALNLGGTGINDLSDLKMLTNLRILYLDRNGISDISALADLTVLEGLELSGNEITDISALSGLVNLKTLSLTYNQVSDLSPLLSLNQIMRLYLMGNRVDSIWPLASMQNLQELDIRDNSDISDLRPLMNLEYFEKYNGPEWSWPMDGKSAILGVFPEGADDKMLDAFNSAISGHAQAYAAIRLSSEESRMVWKYLLENDTQSLKVDAIFLMPYENEDYSETRAKAVQNGCALHFFNGATAEDVYADIEALYK